MLSIVDYLACRHRNSNISCAAHIRFTHFRVAKLDDIWYETLRMDGDRSAGGTGFHWPAFV